VEVKIVAICFQHIAYNKYLAQIFHCNKLEGKKSKQERYVPMDVKKFTTNESNLE
jgi:hypothetical protein